MKTTIKLSKLIEMHELLSKLVNSDDVSVYMPAIKARAILEAHLIPYGEVEIEVEK